MITTDQMVRLGQLALLFGRKKRATFHEDCVTMESDTDHTVMLGLVACAAATHIPSLNSGRVAELVLVHDLVEAHAGDTNTFNISAQAAADKKEREAAAMVRLQDEFADVPYLLQTLEAYEEQVEVEARFVRYMDKAMPKITHLLNGCYAIWGPMGRTFDDLVEDHRTQLERLNAEYPEFADVLGPLMNDVMRQAEAAWAWSSHESTK